MLSNPIQAFRRQSASALIEQAIQYVGISPSQIDDDKKTIAIYTLNEILKSWCNRGVIQFNLIHGVVKLQPNIPSYQLPSIIYQTLDCTRVNTNRITTGVSSSSSGGTAANAFDGNIFTACTQTAIDGNISLMFTSANLIQYVGVLSNTTSQYLLTFETSNDGINWTPVYTMRRPEIFYGGKSEINTKWFKVLTPLNALYFRVREIGGGILDISELYFEVYVTSIYLGPQSQDSYDGQSAKLSAGLPSTYSIFKDIDSIIMTLWSVPQSNNLTQTTLMDLRCLQYPFDINYLSYPIDINEKFLPALRKALTYEFALLWSPDKSQMFKGEYVEEFAKVKGTDQDIGKLEIKLPPIRM